MNNTTRFLPISHFDGSPLAPDDPRVPFARAVATAAVVIAELDSTNATLPTSCPDWNAQAVAGHLVAVLDRVAALPTGRDLDEMPLIRDDVAVSDMADAFTAAAHTVQAAWTDGALDQIVTTPWAPIPGAIALNIYTAEVLTHTWDLASAIGVEPEWHVGDVEHSVQVMQFGLPAEPRGTDDMPFTAVVPTAADAPPIHRLVAWVGRHPAA